MKLLDIAQRLQETSTHKNKLKEQINGLKKQVDELEREMMEVTNNERNLERELNDTARKTQFGTSTKPAEEHSETKKNTGTTRKRSNTKQN